MADKGEKGDEPGLPKSTVNRLINELLNADLKLSSEVRDMLAECCTEFVQLVSSEANELVEKEKKTLVTPEHVVAALQSLGFSAFTAEVLAALEAWKAEDKVSGARKAKLKPKSTGMSEEEAIAAQQKLFAEARARVYAEQQQAPGGS